MNRYIRQAVRGLRSNLSRTLLTTLGIVIGVGTVILVLSVGDGFKSYVNNQVEVYGSNTLFIETVVPPTTKARNSGNTFSDASLNSAFQTVPVNTFKNKDVTDIKRLNNVADAYGVLMGQEIVSYQGIVKSALLMGSDASRFSIDKGQLTAGRPYTEEENLGLAQVAVLGSAIKNDLFGEEDPIGKIIKVGNYNFTVVGVYEKRGGGAGGMDNDQLIFIPLKTLQKKISGADYLLYAVVALKDNSKASTSVIDIEDLLRRNHYITDSANNDFKVQSQAQALASFDTILNAIKFLLIAIAAISLLVGGVGVMNIMYVVVTERISEIGLKKAIGAKNSDILLEFLLEAVLVTLVGGIGGIILGSLLSFGVSKIMNSMGYVWVFSVSISGIVTGVGVSSLIGIIFGVWPAVNASRLNPIEALRSE